MQHKAMILATAWLMSAAAGCATTWQPKPEGWPDTVAGRTLYVTPAAFLYASSPSAAAEIDNVVRGASAEFKARTGETPAKVVVIVIDANDPLPFKSAKELLAARMISKAHREGTPEPNEGGVEAGLYALNSQGKNAWPLELMWTSEAIVLDSAVAEQFLQLPPIVANQAGMVLVVPTQRRIDQAADAMIDHMLRELPAAKRVVMAVMVATTRTFLMGVAVEKQRQVPVFETFVYLQRDWTEEKKQQILAGYRSEKDREAREVARSVAKSMPVRPGVNLETIAASQPTTMSH